MMVEEELRWETGDEFIYGVNDKSLDETFTIFDILFPLVNLVSILQLVALYKLLSQLKARRWCVVRPADISSCFCHSCAACLSLPMARNGPPNCRFLLSAWAGFWNSSLRNSFLLEMAILVTQPMPNVVLRQQFTGDSWVRHIGLLMFLKLYLVGRVMRDRSAM